MTVSETLMIAIATIAMLIGAGQLAIALRTAQPRRKNERAKLERSIRRLIITALIALIFGTVGFLRFVLGEEAPTRSEITHFGASLILILEAVFLVTMAIIDRAAAQSSKEIEETERRVMKTINLHSHR